MLVVFLICALIAVLVHAGAGGDDQYGNIPGVFYAFGQTGMTVFDPSTMKILKHLPDVKATSFGDAIYLRDQAQLKHYVFAANADSPGIVFVVDTDTHSLLSAVRTGDRPWHVYAVAARDEAWVHLDQSARFDVFHMSQARYRRSSGAVVSTVNNGHGKLLIDSSLENTAFATARDGCIVTQVDLESRQAVRFVSLNVNNVTNITCSGTHAAYYSNVNNQIYIETRFIPQCLPPFTNASVCTSSVWVINSRTMDVVARLSSPYLSSLYGPNFGMFGQVYKTPEEQFMIVPNRRMNIVHILKPMADGSTRILEVRVKNTPCFAQFYAKDPSITFAPTAHPSNYVTVISLAAAVPDAGFALIDMAKVVAAFDKNLTMMQDTDVDYVAAGPGDSIWTTIERGSDFAAIPIWNAAIGNSDRVAVLNIRTRTVKYLSIPGVTRLTHVPIFTDELGAQVKVLQSERVAMQASIMQLQDRNAQVSGALAIGAVALALVLVVSLSMLYQHCRGSKQAGNGMDSVQLGTPRM